MKVKLDKDWGDHKKGNEIDVLDEAVLIAGSKAGVFTLPKNWKPKSKTEATETEE